MSSESIYKFIEYCSKRFQNKYDYSKVVFTHLKNKITIICPVHGEFNQVAGDHKRSKIGCFQCNKKSTKSTKPKRNLYELIREFNQIHKNKYDYSLVSSTKTQDKVPILCSKHGEFKQSVNSHLVGQGCPVCAIENKRPAVKSYKFSFPSGNTYNVQGYEPLVLKSLLDQGYIEEDIQLTNRPAVKYFWSKDDGFGDDKWHWYFPDIILPKEHKIIEVKSTFSWDGKGTRPDWKSKNLAKQKYSLLNGWKFEFVVLDEKGLQR